MSHPPIRRGEIWWVSLDPTQGSEIKKTRPCVVLTQDKLNELRRTVVVIPLSTSPKAYPPITVAVHCEDKKATAIIDQVRAVAKHRLKDKIHDLAPSELQAVSNALATILELK